MDVFHLGELLARRSASGRPYLEFQRSEDLSTGLYVLATGAVDLQQPHTEDEIYVVVEGRGRFRAGDDDTPVGPGTVLFVAAGRPHRFHAITEELRIVVAFGPAEGRGRA